MVAQPPAQVYQSVHPVAAQYGVPDPIWETVAYMESGYNPNATGDAGTSFGLFQLHEGGQLRSAPSAVTGAAGERQNAIEAMPAIADTWSALKASFDPASITWWRSFAAQSGHPGGSPGMTVTDNAAAKLLSDYSGTALGQNYTSALSPYTVPVSQSSCPVWCGLLPLQTWGPCTNCDAPSQGMQNLQSGITALTDPGWWARVGVLILGGLLIIMGAIKLLK